ncbi:MAG TPA: TIM barrel protein [Cellvibrionaceae bacterium]
MDFSRRQCVMGLASIVGAATLGRHLSVLGAAEQSTPFDFDISLAQWSLNKAFFDKSLSPLDFPAVARTSYDIGAVEYVNQFFMDKARDQVFLQALKQRAVDHNVKNLLIMVDGEGDLSTHQSDRRQLAVQNHYKWIEAAADLDCESIRVNLHGAGDEKQWHQASVDSLRELVEFSRDYNINILVENHGGFSSHGAMLAAVLAEVDDPLCGSMPDFGNFCYEREDGGMWNSPCVKQYDVYQGVADLMPFAGAISAKTFDFDEQGQEVNFDYLKLFRIIQAAGYRGYVGIEYEGHTLSADAGIRATIALLESVRTTLQGAA